MFCKIIQDNLSLQVKICLVRTKLITFCKYVEILEDMFLAWTRILVYNSISNSSSTFLLS